LFEWRVAVDDGGVRTGFSRFSLEKNNAQTTMKLADTLGLAVHWGWRYRLDYITTKHCASVFCLPDCCTVYGPLAIQKKKQHN
jgi:hypothetical protein